MKISSQYLAGVLDSDGSLSINRTLNHGKTRQYRPVFQLTWKYIDETMKIMEYLKEKYGGSVFIEKSKKKLNMNGHYLAYKLDSKGLKQLLKEIRPYLLIKYKQCDLLIELLNTLKGKGTRPSEEVWERRKQLYEECKKINHMIKEVVSG
ncbi:MAG: hypothetical protein GWN01_07015 [Nitrosopumilaceae archaeon]|nr:hypothetical protein [Nitrosopumilaceae archaeon]NIU86136.1 hypothetical protein [Nitrosopumilaceae archaeon]NIX61284.1 hypothetical protein [Nitrosopumilaceae archaeon]